MALKMFKGDLRHSMGRSQEWKSHVCDSWPRTFSFLENYLLLWVTVSDMCLGV